MQRIQYLNNQIKQNQTSQSQGIWVTKLAQIYDFQKFGNLKGKTVLITGASRGIGLSIGKRCAQDGANIVILAKTAQPNPKLPGTIHTAADEIIKLGGKALPIICDIRFEDQVKQAIEKAVQTFGGIDILINNASAISLTDTESTDMKKYDLMHQINTRGTFMVSKYCLPHLKKSINPHILNISPPLNMQKEFFGPHVAYTMAKYGMSMCVLGMSYELKDYGIGVNALWPRTSISTAAVQNLLGGDNAIKVSRKEEIMSDSAYVILTSDSKKTTGNFFVDDEVLASVGVQDFSKYRCDPNVQEYQLAPDFFL
ncbi:short chain dehydrogenase reductase family protein, putative [Ichthyophthirius multifiliis]|uniref:Hydroxysteroid dehydrogenase-like protein 2 n=1 Tax=Ichthyophthirius multifiliis TaxID=5932 RepID=G0QK57_ICHMU|nr:short chain dehydrogenase reductase family protein, putative [Ichthyophthirius multifiliis]EGR34402.1 short chain dehydrogenase reductase family protein, putative [Ichthyophthirius multifiliis]|eukprot:XP_004039706.1 short chain dehydrogenase reductase family protein, putative [Ichthyophthirius multifiliis]